MEAIIWIVLTIIFAALEIATVGLTSIWFAGGALAALLCYALGLDIVWQVIIFIAVSLVLLVFTRPWALKYFKPHLVRTNYEEALEKTVCITETVDNRKSTGTAVFNGQEWTARSYVDGKVLEAGTIAKVKEIRGVTMYLVESESMPKLDKQQGEPQK